MGSSIEELRALAKNKESFPKDLNQVRKIHILGVSGTLMGAFAVYLKKKGFEVSGSDLNIYPPMSDLLKNANILMVEGYDASNLQKIPKPDLVVVGNVIRPDNPEMLAILEKNIPFSSLPSVMERFLLTQTTNLVVAGTHGKTTTSSLLAFTLRESKKDPSYFIGGVSPDLPQSFHIGSEKGYFVLEGDEYDTSFWDKVPKFFHYRPTHAILTSVEYDHADIYPNLEAVVKAFQGLLDRVSPKGSLLACTDYAEVRKLLKNQKLPYRVITYGLESQHQPQYLVQNVKDSPQKGIEFELQSSEKTVSIRVHLGGRHNALNAAAVWIELIEQGLKPKQIQEAFLKFKGIKRRQEVRGVIQERTVIDDFAHHPTAVRETLLALKGQFPKSRMVAVFEPRSATSRKKVFQKDYVDAFSLADAVFLAEPYDSAGVDPTQRFSSAELVKDLKNKKIPAQSFEQIEKGVQQVADFSQAGDVIAVLSNGGFEGFIPKLLEALKAR